MQIRDITPEEITHYQARGAAYIPQLIDRESAEQLRKECLRADRPAGRYKNALSESGGFYEERFMGEHSDMLRAFALDARLGKSAAAAMQSPSARFLFDHLLVCGPNNPVPNYWHQDISYWPIEGQQVCSLWITLTDCTVESSALEIVLDSDKGEVHAIRPFGEEDMGDEVKKNYDKGAIPKYHEMRDKYDILSRDMKAGDAYLFNARVMHASGGNRSKDVQRVALSLRYIGEDVVWHPRPAFDPEALTPDDVVLNVGDKFHGRMFPEIWPGRPA